ncbi:Isochorismatase hydrolase [Lepidopterella palustris CBS 459.81]|uniref:Isochorismatase hydrolase n=1 Tax=Lepidopterella palustris CBS 459.81 TaxID=1314670 RepID=A0A8E2JDH7_9PEZI|nr:Isochorismatase hydrolase [Lepidopterella palustris CBS 459.81]
MASPTKTALIIIDMQNHFLPMTGLALPNIIKLNNFFASHSLPRIFTQHGHSVAELTPPFRNQLVRKWGLDNSIATGSHSPVVAKNTYDAFLNTELDDVLRRGGVQRVVVCGVMTDCCCDTTARTAFNKGYETWLVKDATGSANETQHKRGLAAFGFAFGDVVDTDEVVRRLC